MTAMTHDRNTRRRDGVKYSFPVSGGKNIFTGAVVAIQPDGYAAPGTTGTGLRTVGVAERNANATGKADGVVQVEVRRGCFALRQGTEPLTLADAGQVCYLVDDQTVTKTDGNGTRSIAGIVRDVDSDGVWVEL